MTVVLSPDAAYALGHQLHAVARDMAFAKQERTRPIR
jgi:hypothetical protein